MAIKETGSLELPAPGLPVMPDGNPTSGQRLYAANCELPWTDGPGG